MKKILLTIFALLSLNLAVFAYSETDFFNDYAVLGKLKEQMTDYAAKRDHDNTYIVCSKMLERMLPMYQYLIDTNRTQIQGSLATLIGNTYEMLAVIDRDMYNNPDKAASEFMEAVQKYCEHGKYTNAEAAMTESLNISGLDKTKLADCYKVRAQIRQKLKNTTGAQEDYNKYNELMNR